MKHIWLEDAQYMAIIEDLLSTPEVQSLEKFVHHKVTNRLTHSLAVSYYSYRMAKKMNLDARSTARAGLLHDLFFYESDDKHAIGGRGHNYEHPRIALANAKKLTELNELECDIILKHMCGATNDVPKYKESWIVTMMDKRVAMMELAIGSSRLLAFKMRTYQLMINNYYRPIYSGVDTIIDPINE